MHNRTRVRGVILHFGVRRKDGKSRFAKYIKVENPQRPVEHMFGVKYYTLEFEIKMKKGNLQNK